MRIEETDIPDISIQNIDKTKMDLAENIISVTYPLLNQEYIEEMKQTRDLNKKVKDSKAKILKHKEIISKKYEELKKRKKEQILLDRIRKLVSSGLLSKDITLKNERVVLLKVIDDVPMAKLDSYLSETMNIISKRGIQ